MRLSLCKDANGFLGELWLLLYCKKAILDAEYLMMLSFSLMCNLMCIWEGVFMHLCCCIIDVEVNHMGAATYS